jgi:3-deoxy-7-phosphoheptulonate synthase
VAEVESASAQGHLLRSGDGEDADPSHGTGHTHLVTAMARASIAAGADGLIVEVHPNPDKAMSDGHQSLNFRQFEDMM